MPIPGIVVVWSAIGAALLAAGLLLAGLVKVSLDLFRRRIPARELALLLACALPAVLTASTACLPQVFVGAGWGASRLFLLWSWALLLLAAQLGGLLKGIHPSAKPALLAWLALLLTLVGGLKTASLTSERILHTSTSGQTTVWLTTRRDEEDLFLRAKGPDGRLRGPKKIADSIGGVGAYGFEMTWAGEDSVEVRSTKIDRPPFPARLPEN